MKKRQAKLPLDDPRWAPLDDLHGLLIPRTGNRDLAAHDLTKLLATPPPRGVRSMRRYFGRYRDLSRPDLEREQLEFSFWEEHALSSWSDGLCIVRPKQGVGQAIRAVGIYAWKPDFDKAVLGLAPAMEIEAVVRSRPGPKSRYPFWRFEAAAFAHDFYKKKKRTPTAGEIAEHLQLTCDGWAPDESDIRDLLRFLIHE